MPERHYHPEDSRITVLGTDEQTTKRTAPKPFSQFYATARRHSKRKRRRDTFQVPDRV